jgi:hypothetical protein
MGRSGYSDDYEGEVPLELYRRAVENAIAGRRGQALLLRLRDALDAMPTKRLIADAVRNKAGEVCAFGALDAAAPQYHEEDEYSSPTHAERLAAHFNVAPALAAEIVYENDEAMSWRSRDETPEQRWVRMRAWVEAHILREKPESHDIVMARREREERARAHRSDTGEADDDKDLGLPGYTGMGSCGARRHVERTEMFKCERCGASTPKTCLCSRREMAPAASRQLCGWMTTMGDSYATLHYPVAMTEAGEFDLIEWLEFITDTLRKRRDSRVAPPPEPETDR